MPSQKPRLALTLEGPLKVAIDDLADAASKPATRVITELLTELIPQMEGLAKVMRASKSGNKAAAKRALVHMLGDNLAEMMTMQQPELFGKGKRK